MRVVYLFTAVLLLCSVLYAPAIRLVDPYGDFGTGRFPLVVLDSRRQKLKIFKNYARTQPVTGLVMGSSRSLKIRPALFKGLSGGRFFNFAVENAHAEDFLAIYHWVRGQNADPAVIVLGLDLACLNNDDAPDPMFLRTQELNDSLAEPLGGDPGTGLLPSWLQRTKDTFTFDYAKDAAKSVTANLRGQAAPVPLDPDGYTQPAQSANRLSATQPPRGIEPRDRLSYAQRLQHMTELSPKRCRYLTTLLQEAAGRKAQVVIWLTPIHPQLETEMTAAPRYAELMTSLRRFAGQLGSFPGVRVFDYTDIQRFQGTLAGWDDATHMDETNSDLVARHLIGATR